MTMKTASIKKEERKVWKKNKKEGRAGVLISMDTGRADVSGNVTCREITLSDKRSFL